MKQTSFNENNQNFKLKWIYVIFGIIIMMCLGTVYSYSIFRTPVEQMYNIGATKSGLPYMFSLAFYALFMMLTGKYLEKYNPKLIISIGGILVGIGWILSSFAPNIYLLTITYGVIIGSGVGIAYGVPMTVAAKWFPDKKGLIVGLVLVGFGLSPFITAPFARYLIEIFDVRHTLLILGIIFGVTVPILSLPFQYPMTTQNDVINNKIQDDTAISTKAMVKLSDFKALYILFIIGTMIGLMIVGMTSNVGMELIKLSSSTVAIFMSLFALFNGIGRPIFGWFADKISHKKAMVLSFSLILIAAILMLTAKENSVWQYIISFSIFWFNLGGWLAIAPATTMTLFGTKHYSQNYGVVFSAYGVGAISGVLISGMLKDYFHNYNVIFYLIILLSIFGLLFTRKINE